MNKELKVALGIGFIVGIVFLSVFYFVNKSLINDWNEYCDNKGLPDKCTLEDECKKDCNDLGNDFFKLGDCGWNCNNCWCLINNTSTQIW